MVGIALKFCMGDINFMKIEKEKKMFFIAKLAALHLYVSHHCIEGVEIFLTLP
jgi:hypothetical protein